MILYQNENSSIPYRYDRSVYQNFHFVAHLHRSFELIMVLHGSVTMTVEHQTFTLCDGDLALILPNQVHSFETPESSTVLVSVFALEYVPFLTKATRGKGCLSNLFRMDAADEEFLKRKLMQDHLTREQLSAYLSLAAAEFLAQATLVPIAQSEKSNLLFHQMLEYVSSHYRENISLEEMAKALGYESHYLSRCFHAYFHQNFRGFINEYRINYARHLMTLEGREMTLTEIAFASGFQSVRNFNRIYRSVTGVAPSAER